MSNNLWAPRKCGKSPELCLTDVHWAREQAMVSARAELSWSQEKLARLVGLTRNTIRRWERGDTTIQQDVFDRVPVFAAAYHRHRVRHEGEIRGKRAA